MLKFRLLLGVRGVGLALFFSAIYPGVAAERQVLHGHVPAAVARFNLQPTGQLPATNRLALAIGLPLRNQAGLSNLIQQLYDPASPNYHRYLTPEQFAERFGPTEQDYQKVIAFFQTNGLIVAGTHSDRMLLDVNGSVANLEKAFHVTMRVYQHPTEKRQFYAPDVEPSVASNIPILGINGLNNYALPRPLLRKATASNQPLNATPAAGSGPSGTYLGTDLRAAYVPGVTLTGADQAVGLLEFDGYYPNDITTYESSNGLPNVPLTNILIDSFSGSAGGNNDEVALDIEMAISMAPGLSRVVVYEAGPYGNAYDVLDNMATNILAMQISSSWFWGGGPNPNMEDQYFQKFAAQGQSYFQASGDSDAYSGSTSSDYPSDDPYVTSVGGTTLTNSGPGGSYVSETVWNWGNIPRQGYIGSSGGISTSYSIPYWQTNINMTANQGSTTMRNVPDVALTANNVWITYGNGLSATNYGGTSFAAPLWAGFTALVNQQAAALGSPPVGFLNPAIYAIANGPNYASDFHDTTTGNNTRSGSTTKFYATTGYDLCTGLGTPNGTNLINALAGPPNPLAIAPASGFAAIGAAGGPFNVAAQIFLLTNSSAASLNWTLANTTPWLNVSPGSGTLASGGQTTVTASLNSAAYTLAVGTYSATVWFTNQTMGVALFRQFALQVLQPLAVSPTNGFTSSGPVGGPFGVTTQIFSLINLGAASLNWSVNNTASWLTASPNSGTLAPGGQTPLTVSLNSAANSLAAGTYNANVVITNQNGAAVALPFTLLVGQSLVQNGGFETGDFTGWTLNGSSAYDFVTTSSAISGMVHSGSYGAALGQYGSLAYLYQILATSPGQNYLLSLWLDNPTNTYGATPNQFLVQWNGTTIFNQTNLPYTAWTNLQFMVTATSASTVLQFGFDNNPWYLGLDDISITPVPVPAFQAATKTSSSFNLSWGTIAGLLYQVQYKTNLFQASWINLGKPLVATNGSLTVSDTNATDSLPQRFYRLMVLP
jgi:hypothetical protein